MIEIFLIKNQLMIKYENELKELIEKGKVYKNVDANIDD